MGDKVGGRGKKSQKMGDVIYGRPQANENNFRFTTYLDILQN